MVAVDNLRKEGIKAGVVGIRVLRPFPMKELYEAIKSAKAIATLDRSSPGGALGMLFNEVSGSLIGNGVYKPIVDYIYGLGGRDITVAHIEGVFKELLDIAEKGRVDGALQRFINLRGKKLECF